MKKIRFFALITLIATLPTLATTSLSAEQIGCAEEDQIVIPDFYKEEGQVNLDKLIIFVDNNDSLRCASTYSTESSQQYEELNELMSKDSSLEESLASLVKDGQVPIAIGYTRVYLKKNVTENGTVTYSPIEKDELEGNQNSRAIGNTSYDGCFTLYTAASWRDGKIWASSMGSFGSNMDMQHIPSLDVKEYIGISFPSDFQLVDHSIETPNWGTGGVYSTKNAQINYVYLMKTGGNKMYTNITLAAKGLPDNDESNSTNKIISYYYHTWDQLSFNFEWNSQAGMPLPTGITVNTHYWVLSSYVTLSK